MKPRGKRGRNVSSLPGERRSHFQAVDGTRTPAEGVSSVRNDFPYRYVLVTYSYVSNPSKNKYSGFDSLAYPWASDDSLNEQNSRKWRKEPPPRPFPVSCFELEASGSCEVFMGGRCSDLPTFWKVWRVCAVLRTAGNRRV